MPVHSQSIVDNTARIEVIGGQPVVVIGDRMFALSTVNTGSSTIASGVPVTTDAASKQPSDPSSTPVPDGLSALSSKPSRASTLTPSSGPDLQTLKAQQSVKKQELRTVEQTEVLQAGQQSEAWRAGMIEKKRSLIVELDALRKQITALENKNTATNPPNSVHDLAGAATGPTAMLPLAPQFQQALPQPMYGFPQASPYPPIMMYQSPYSTFPGFPTPEPAQFVPPPPNVPPRSPNSANRRSRAIEIKPPHEETKRQSSSALDPKSPTYEPVSRYEPVKGAIPPTPSPNKQSPWSHQGTLRSDKAARQALSTKPSLSSIDTTDFFPTNTHEHSTTRVAPQVNESTQASKENTAAPSTPDRDWPASPWNEHNSGRSQQKEPTAKLTSWPEAFGKPPSMVSLRQGTSSQPSVPMLNRVPRSVTNVMDASPSKTAAEQTDSEQPAGSEVWPLSLSKPVMHVPSTYQEGYQAGYDHVGMPDDPEVLQGFIQGLLNFLSDESVKRRNDLAARGMYPRGVDLRSPSVQSFVVPQDSAISMTFKHNEAPMVSLQENINHAKGNTADSTRRDSAYSQQQTSRSMSVTAAPATGFVEEPRQRIDCGSKQPGSFSPYTKGFGSAYRHVDTSNLDSEANKATLNQPGMETQQPSSVFGRVFLGNQLTNGAHTTRMPMQRFYLNQKELDPSKTGQDGSSSARLPPAHRFSGLDGAMDELEGLVIETRLDDRRPSSDNRPSSDRRSAAMTGMADSEDIHASCPRPFGGKNKNKQSSSPTKAAGSARDSHVSSPANPPSPSKAPGGEVSPAKARLDQVTNKFRRGKKDDTRAMSPEEKKKRSEKWRQRFQYIKKTEAHEIEQYNRDNNVGN